MLKKQLEQFKRDIAQGQLTDHTVSDILVPTLENRGERYKLGVLNHMMDKQPISAVKTAGEDSDDVQERKIDTELKRLFKIIPLDSINGFKFLKDNPLPDKKDESIAHLLRIMPYEDKLLFHHLLKEALQSVAIKSGIDRSNISSDLNQLLSVMGNERLIGSKLGQFLRKKADVPDTFPVALRGTPKTPTEERDVSKLVAGDIFNNDGPNHGEWDKALQHIRLYLDEAYDFDYMVAGDFSVDKVKRMYGDMLKSVGVEFKNQPLFSQLLDSIKTTTVKKRQTTPKFDVDAGDDTFTQVDTEVGLKTKGDLSGKGLNNTLKGYTQLGGNVYYRDNNMKENELSLIRLSQNGRKNKPIKNRRISDNFKKMLLGKSVRPKNISLSEDEHALFEKITKMTGERPVSPDSKKMVQNRYYSGIEELLTRLKVIMGEVSSGNDSKELLNEGAELVRYLEKVKHLSKKTAKDYIKTFGFDK